MSNDAAERLRIWIQNQPLPYRFGMERIAELDEALAAERKAGAAEERERIRVDTEASRLRALRHARALNVGEAER